MSMQKRFTGISLVIFISILISFVQPAAAASNLFEAATVKKISSESTLEYPEGTFYVQELEVRLEDGSTISVPHGSEFQPVTHLQRLAAGNQVIVMHPESDQVVGPVIYEEYRLPILLWLFVGFVLLVLIVAGVKGLLSILGMFISLGILMGFVVPQILAGANALIITVVAAILIATVTVYLSHGWKIGSHIALGSILITLVAVSLLSYWFVSLARLTCWGHWVC